MKSPQIIENEREAFFGSETEEAFSPVRQKAAWIGFTRKSDEGGGGVITFTLARAGRGENTLR